MLKSVLILSVLLAVALPAPRCVAADPATASQTAPDSALTARFAAFLTGILAGHLPTTGVSDKMKAGFTPDLISQVNALFAPLGAFKSLQFVSQDSAQGFQRYHYIAVFDKGTRPLLFVLDSSGNIAGFFKDQPQ